MIVFGLAKIRVYKRFSVFSLLLRCYLNQVNFILFISQHFLLGSSNMCAVIFMQIKVRRFLQFVDHCSSVPISSESSDDTLNKYIYLQHNHIFNYIPNWRVCTLPPIRSEASSTTTSSTLCSMRVAAAEMPATPAPTTTTRCFSSPLRQQSVLADFTLFGC